MVGGANVSRGDSDSVLATILSGKGKATAAIDEIKAVLDDLRVAAVGGIQGGLYLWELSVSPFLLNNASTLTDIMDGAIQELDRLQELFLRVLLEVPRSTPKPLLYWDTGTMTMANRIKVMKLNLMVHLKKLDQSSLAKQVLDEQIRHDWPGLAKEAKEICQKWKMENVTREEEEVKSKKVWKRMIQKKAKEEEGKELRERMKTYQKLQDKIEEDYGKKAYFDKMSSKDAKLWFRVRSKMIKCKMNFSSDKKNSDSLWLCECGCIFSLPFLSMF